MRPISPPSSQPGHSRKGSARSRLAEGHRTSAGRMDAAPGASESHKTPPRFQQIKDEILRRIREGDYQVDEALPAEPALAEHFRVSRMTVNRALKELAEAGYLYRISGSGTYVAERTASGDLIELRDFVDELESRGYQHSMLMLARESVEAPPRIAARFEAFPGYRLFYARILHFRDDLPVLLEDRYVDPKLAPDFASADLTKETVRRYLQRVIASQETEQVIRAVAPGAEVRDLLETIESEPCLLLRQRIFAENAVLSVADLYYAASRYEIAGRSAA